jgi:hypothetical protein
VEPALDNFALHSHLSLHKMSMSQPPHESIRVERIPGEGIDTRMSFSTPLDLVSTLSLSGVQPATGKSLHQRKIKHPRDNSTFLMDQGPFSICTTRWQRKKTIRWPIAGRRMQMASLFSWVLILPSISVRCDQAEYFRLVCSLLRSRHWSRYRSRT